jgi:hypothetical protein
MEHFIYRDSDGGLHGYDSEAECKRFGRKDLVRVTGKELEVIVNPQQSPATNEQIEHQRLLAYSDRLTGSDRFKIEADAERLSGNERAAVAAEEKWLARRAEIASELPWPEE